MRKPNGLTDLAVLAVAVLMGVATMALPQPRHDPAAGEFQVENAERHLAAIAQRPHPLGSEELVLVRDYLTATLDDAGWDTEVQSVATRNVFGAPGTTVRLHNVLARRAGTASTGSILLIAHYDTVPSTPGANDNSTPVAALLEAVRAISTGEALSNDVIVLFTDAEEPAGRAGAAAFIAAHPWVDDVAFVMNFEAAGGSGPAVLVQTGPAQAWTVAQLAAASSRPVAFSFLTELVSVFGEVGTDFDPFLARGTEGIHVAYLRGGSLYHTERDDLDAANRDGLVHHGSYALSMARHLGAMDLSLMPTGGDTSTFFTVWPGQMVRYSNGTAVVLAVVVAAAAAALIIRGVRRQLTARSMLARTGWVLTGAVIGSAVATLAWMGIVAARPTMGSVEAYLFMALLVGAGVGVRVLVSRRSTGPDDVSGVVVAWALVTVGLAVWVPGASYLFAWPALVAAGALLVWPHPSRYGHVARLAMVSVVTAIVLVPAVDLFLAMAQPRPGNPDSELTEAFALVALLAILCFELLLPFLRQSRGPDDPIEASRPTELAMVA